MHRSSSDTAPTRGRRQLQSGFATESPIVLAAAAVTCILLLAATAALGIYNHLHPSPSLHLNPNANPFWGKFHLNAYLLTDLIPYYDAAGQRTAHRLVLYALAAALLLALSPMAKKTTRLFARPGFRWTLYVLAASCLIALIVASSRYQRLPIAAAALGAAATLALCDPRARRFAPIARRAAKFACLFLLAAAILPALACTPDLSDYPWTMITTIQMHYSLVVGVADHLALGQRLYSQVGTEYGTLFQFLAACYERHFGMLSMADFFHVLQALNAVYLIAAIGVYHAYARGKWIFILLAMALIVPFYHFRHQCLLFPNQAAWRTLSFPLMLLACSGLRRHHLPTTSVLLGLLGGIAIAINVESGAAACAAAAAYLYFRHVLSARRFIPTAAAAAFGLILGLVLSLAAILLIWRLLLPPAPRWADVSQALTFVRFFVASNFGAAPFKWSIPATLIFAHAVFILIHSGLDYRHGAPPHAAVRAAAAAIVVVWFAYYFNRPLNWNLSSLLMPYGLLLIDLARMLTLFLSKKRIVNGLSVAAFAMICLAIVPQYFQSWDRSNFLRTGENRIVRFTTPRPDSARLLSGVYFPAAGADDIATKAAFIEEAAKAAAPLYITTDSYLLPKLSGAYSRVLSRDFFVETTTEDKYRQIISFCLTSGAPRIFLDAPKSLSLGVPSYAGLYCQLRKDLSVEYHPTTVENGWEIWQKN